MSETTQAKYKTEPLQAWQKCKELRLFHYKEVVTAKERGMTLASGSAGARLMSTGLPGTIFLSGEPYGASVATDTAFAQTCMEAFEARGFARDICAYMKNYLGSMFLKRFFFGGDFPKPDFYITMHICDTHAKWYQIAAEVHGVPYFGMDIPWGATTYRPEQRIEYLTGQILDAIEWQEKVSGKKWDDERFIDILYNDSESQALWAEIAVLNQAIPAPLDMKSIFSLYFPAFILADQKETPGFYRMLRDEMRHRVDNHIAALPTERYRLLFDGQPPWYFLRLFRIMERFGAVGIACFYAFAPGEWVERPGRFWEPQPSMRQRGVSVKTREDSARCYAERLVHFREFDTWALPEVKSTHMVQLVRQWHCGGAVMHLNRGCEGVAGNCLENRLALVKEGIPVVTFEGNMADRREFNETEVIDRIESFMESLGLTRLEEH